MKQRKLVSIYIAILWAVVAKTPLSAQVKNDDPEVKIGRDGAAETEKELKIVADPVLNARVTKIGQDIAAIANVTEVHAMWGDSTVKKFIYSFKIVDDKDVNAFSLPGGFIYVNKGLLDYVHSDDELAGVLAHEVAHASHHHMMRLLSIQRKMQLPTLLAAVAAAALSKDHADSGMKALVGAQLYMTAKLNTYGTEAEKDADHAGMLYMAKTKYNPVGLLTFMERLARDEQKAPEIDYGIYRNHPPSPDRARAALNELADLKIAVNRREADPGLRATAAMGTGPNVALAEVKMYKTIVARFSDDDSGKAIDRANTMAERLNRLFDSGLQMYEVRMSADKTRIIGRQEVLVTFKDSDAVSQKLPVTQLSQNVLEAVRNLLWQDQFNRPVSRL